VRTNRETGQSKLVLRRQAQVSRGRIAARWFGVARKNRAESTPLGKDPAVDAAQVARPEVERSTGARVGSRLQKSVRGIFVAADEGSREANRAEAT